MCDYVIMSVKRGNKIHAVNKPVELLHGHPVDFIDPDIYNPILAEYARKAFLYFRIPKTMVAALENYLVVDENEKNFARKKQVDLTKISQVIDIGGITNTENNMEILPLFDIGMMCVEDIFKSNQKYEVTDLAVTTGGTPTVGTAGTFPTIAQLFADLGNLLSNLSWSIISDLTETVVSTITENLAGNAMRQSSTKSWNGLNEDGWLVSVNHAGGIFVVECEGPGVFEIGDIRLKFLQVFADYALKVQNVVNTFDGKYHDMCWDGDAKLAHGVYVADVTPKSHIWNNVFRGLTGSNMATVGGNVDIIFENNTIFEGNIGIDPVGGLCVVRNNFVLNTVGVNYNRIGAANGYANAGNGATVADGNWNIGTGNQASVTVSDEIETLTSTAHNFLRPKKYSHYRRIEGVTHKNGVAPGIAENIKDVAGRPRPHRGDRYTIGAYEVDRKLSCLFGMGR